MQLTVVTRNPCPLGGFFGNGQVLARPVPTYAQSQSQPPFPQPRVCTSCALGQEGVARCEDCQEILCKNCRAAHEIVRVTRDHRITPLLGPGFGGLPGSQGSAPTLLLPFLWTKSGTGWI